MTILLIALVTLAPIVSFVSYPLLLWLFRDRSISFKQQMRESFGLRDTAPDTLFWFVIVTELLKAVITSIALFVFSFLFVAYIS
jgi:hypothetical protein